MYYNTFRLMKTVLIIKKYLSYKILCNQMIILVSFVTFKNAHKYHIWTILLKTFVKYHDIAHEHCELTIYQ